MSSDFIPAMDVRSTITDTIISGLTVFDGEPVAAIALLDLDAQQWLMFPMRAGDARALARSLDDKAEALESGMTPEQMVELYGEYGDGR